MQDTRTLINNGESQTAKFEEFQHGFRITISKNLNVGANVGVSVGVNEIYNYIKANQIAINFPNITQRTIERYIKQLRAEEKIEFEGAPKTGGYVIKGNNDIN